jgi:hypothetical protein
MPNGRPSRFSRMPSPSRSTMPAASSSARALSRRTAAARASRRTPSGSGRSGRSRACRSRRAAPRSSAAVDGQRERTPDARVVERRTAPFHITLAYCRRPSQNERRNRASRVTAELIGQRASTRSAVPAPQLHDLRRASGITRQTRRSMFGRPPSSREIGVRLEDPAVVGRAVLDETERAVADRRAVEGCLRDAPTGGRDSRA